MIIGVPREIRTHEYRVGMVPGGVLALIREGHTVPAVPRTSAQALTNATLPFVIKIANEGLEKAAAEDSALRLGINIFVPKDGGKGVITCKPVADSFGEPHVPIEEVACPEK
ncbi:MAG: hypothetical protein JRJ47_07305 [Deltaproteobacteria bacterium]|nr:hypothetical protein [Deltaproteobacteria bacterium]